MVMPIRKPADQLGRVHTTASGIDYVVPMSHATAKTHVPNKLDQYRREHPEEFSGWYVPKTGGYVIAYHGIKAYRGPCLHCHTGVVTALRKTPRNGDHHQGRGRWPETCDNCRERKAKERAEKHDNGARKRMARLREERRSVRDSDYVADGFEPPRQGVAAVKLEQDDKPPWRSIFQRRQPVLCGTCLEPMEYLVATRKRVTPPSL